MPDYTTPADYMSQCAKYGAYARTNSYPQAVAISQSIINKWKSAADSYVTATAAARDAGFTVRRKPSSNSDTIVVHSLIDFSQHFGDFLGVNQDVYGDSDDKFTPTGVIDLATKSKWQFSVEKVVEEDYKTPDEAALTLTAYLSSEPAEVTTVQGMNPPRVDKGTPRFALHMAPGGGGDPHWYNLTVRATKVADFKLSEDVEKNIGAFMIEDPKWRAELDPITLQAAHEQLDAWESTRKEFESFMVDATAWGKRESKHVAFVNDKNSPFNPQLTGKEANGGDFGATSLATAGGFIKVIMKDALDSGNTMVGFIHARELKGAQINQFRYSITAAQGGGGDAGDWMGSLSRAAVKTLDESTQLSSSWTATSYSRFDIGEVYLKKGSCNVSIKYEGPSKMKWEEMDQYDRFEGKETMPCVYRENLVAAGSGR